MNDLNTSDFAKVALNKLLELASYGSIEAQRVILSMMVRAEEIEEDEDR